MRQISGRLEKFGLRQERPAFRRNDIEIGILVDLMDQKLERIGGLAWTSPNLLRAFAGLNDIRAAAHRFSRRDRIDANGGVKCRSLA